MHLAKLSDQELVKKTKTLAGEERRITAEVLQCLKEIDTRKLYAEYGCSSLHEFCVKILLYSEGQAHRRITAARLLNQIPVIEDKIRTGELSLTNVAQAQAFFREEKKQGRPLELEQKREVLQKLEGLSARQGEQVLAAISPERKVVFESFWALDLERFGFRTEMTRELKEKLERIKSLTGADTYVATLEKMAELTLKAIDPMKKAERAAQRAEKTGEALQDRAERVNAQNASLRPCTATEAAKPSTIQTSDSRSDSNSSPVRSHAPQTGAGPATGIPSNAKNGAHRPLQFEAPKHSQSCESQQRTTTTSALNSERPIQPKGFPSKRDGHRPAIHSTVRHFVWMRDQGRCSWAHPTTGERCTATRYLEIDHVIPYAKGGTDDAGNLRLMCRTHNVHHGVRCFGVQRMNAFAMRAPGKNSTGRAPGVRSGRVAFNAWGA